jgi:hypothetical protein
MQWRKIEIPSANGHGNARSVAAVHSALACGGAHGVRLLSEAGRLKALEPQADGVDLLLGIPIRWGLTFAVESPLFQNRLGHCVAYWGGNGGSLGFVDLDERMAVSYVMNRWIEGPHEYTRMNRILAAVYASLGHPRQGAAS